ncbi:glycosyltransferase [Nonomuraea sp. NPDC003754]
MKGAASTSPRVLHVTQPVDGGVGAYVAAAAADQVRRGWQVAVACPGTGPLRGRLAELGVPWLDWPAGRDPGPRDLAAIRRLRRLVDAFAPDAVHLHSSKAGLAGRAAIRGRIPTLFQPHGWSWLAGRGLVARAALAWERRAARWTGLTVCVGEGEAALARRHGVGGDQVVVRNGVDLRRFRPAGKEERATARERHGILWSAPLAVCVGRITRQKGQDLLLSAWERVVEECPQARLVLVGDGDLHDELRALDVPGVCFVGDVADVRPWYVAADVVVLPSRWEGLPLTALEAMATGRSLVCYDVPGLAELVGDGVGAAVPAEDVAALAEALLLRLSQPGLAAAEGLAAAARSAAFDAAVAFGELAQHTLRTANGGWAGTGGVGGGAGIGRGTGLAETSAGAPGACATGSTGEGVTGAGMTGVGARGVGTAGPCVAGAVTTGPVVTGSVGSGPVVAGPVTGSGVEDGAVPDVGASVGSGVPGAVADGLGTGVGISGVGVAGSGVSVARTCDCTIVRKSSEEFGFDEHCQTPCGQ